MVVLIINLASFISTAGPPRRLELIHSKQGPRVSHVKIKAKRWFVTSPIAQKCNRQLLWGFLDSKSNRGCMKYLDQTPHWTSLLAQTASIFVSPLKNIKDGIKTKRVLEAFPSPYRISNSYSNHAYCFESANMGQIISQRSNMI